MEQNNQAKQKYNIEIADIQLTILSDETEEFVNDIVSRLDTQIRTLTVQNKRCAKIDAAILCALDSLGEKSKLEKKIKNLEAQISLYEANLRRMRTEAPATEKKAPVKKAEETEPAPAEEKAEAEKEPPKPKRQTIKRKLPQQLAMEEAAKEEDAKVDVIASTESAKEYTNEVVAAGEAKPEEAPSVLKSEKLQELESFLKRRSESGAADGDGAKAGGNDKIRQIEELLRAGGGSRSLSDALKDAKND